VYRQFPIADRYFCSVLGQTFPNRRYLLAATSIGQIDETKWNLPALTYRDANAAPMLDMLDLRRPSLAEPPKLAQPLAVADPSALSCSVTGPGTIPPPGSVTG
jgi:phospholipase C